MLRHGLSTFLSILFCLSLATMLIVNTPQSVFAQDDDVELTDEEKEAVAQKKLKELKASSPLLKEPQTEAELLDAAVLMIDFARPGLARAYLDELMASNPDEATLLKLRDQHGPALFLKLARIKQLQPSSTKLLQQMNAVFRKLGADSKRVDSLITKLDGTPNERDVAIHALTSAGAIVVPRLLQQYSSTNDDQTRSHIFKAIVSMGKPIVSPLVAAIDSPAKEVQLVAIDALGQIGDRSALNHLWYSAYSINGNANLKKSARDAINKILKLQNNDVKPPKQIEMANELKRLALIHYQNQYHWKTEEQRGDDLIGFWSWNKKKDQLVVEYVSAELASVRTGNKFSKQAFQLLPENEELQALYLGMAFASDTAENEAGTGLTIGKGTAMNTALAAGEDVVSTTLTQALKYRRADIALSALQVLSQIGSRNQLLLPSGKKSPIVAALNYPDNRVQFAAAITILQLDPQKQFRSSTRVVAILSRALRNEGVPAAVVIHPDTQISVDIAALVSQVGFNATTAKTGQIGFNLAAKRDDIELILVDANVARWGLSQTIANFRADARTAYIPIVVFGPNEMKEKIIRSFKDEPLMSFVDKPKSLEQLNRQLKPFLTTIKTPAPTPEQRTARIESAAYWLAHIANGQRTKIFDIAPAQEALLDSLNDPRLYTNASQALSVIPTKKVQQQFQKIAINTDQKKEVRESAALQLAFHVQRFGLLLDSRDIAEVKTAWKESSDDPELSAAFATIIGSLKSNKTGVKKQLKQLTP